jgi:hypothetical protein
VYRKRAGRSGATALTEAPESTELVTAGANPGEAVFGASQRRVVIPLGERQCRSVVPVVPEGAGKRSESIPGGRIVL